MAYFQVRKAFVSETWLNVDAKTSIAEYQRAADYNPECTPIIIIDWDSFILLI